MNVLSKRGMIFIVAFILLLSGSYLSVDAREIEQTPQEMLWEPTQVEDGFGVNKVAMPMLFPGADPVLTNNNGLTVTAGMNSMISNSELLATDSDTPATGITYTLETTPTNGQLLLLGVPMGPADSFFQSDIDSGNLVYQHNGNAAVSDSFDFVADDDPILMGTTGRDSVDSLGNEGNANSERARISADGRYVVFVSNATNLVAGDTNGFQDVFRHDRVTGSTILISISSGGGQGNGPSYDPDISANGRYVVFHSAANNLVAGDTNFSNDVFLRDTQLNTTTRVSLDHLGNQGAGLSWYATISDDGRYVAFESDAQLVPADINIDPDIYLRDTLLNTTVQISVDSLGNQPNLWSNFAWISGNGRYVAFASDASNLVPGDFNGWQDIFVRDTQLNTTTRVSLDYLGNEIFDRSEFGSISADGRYVSFQSRDGNVVSGDTNGADDVFVRDTQLNTTVRVSVDSDGNQLSSGGMRGDLSDNGAYIAFASGGGTVYVRNMVANWTTVASVNSSGDLGNGSSNRPALSALGSYVVFDSTSSNLVINDTNSVRDIFDHEVTPPPAIDDTFSITILQPPFASDNQYSIVEDSSPASGNVIIDNSGMGTDNGNGALTVYTYTMPAMGTLLLNNDGSFIYTPTVDFSGVDSFTYQITDTLFLSNMAYVTITVTPVEDSPTLTLNEGLTVTTGMSGGITNADLLITDPDTPTTELTYTLETTPTSGQLLLLGVPLAPADSFLQSDIDSGNLVYLHNGNAAVSDSFDFTADDDPILMGTTGRDSVDSVGNEGNAISDWSRISADGRYVVFVSNATNLVGGDTNGFRDVFRHDRVTGSTIRVSVGSGGVQANSASLEPDISANGRYVVFHSNASNLVAGDTNGTSDVFVRDTLFNTTTRVSLDHLGNQASGLSWHATISNDGRYVAFESDAQLVPGDINIDPDIYLRDTQLNTTVQVSVDSSGNQPNMWSNYAWISGNGRYVAFTSEASNLVPGDFNGWQDIFVRDTQLNTTARVSLDYLGNQLSDSSEYASISNDGRYVSFQSMDGNVVLGDTNSTWDVFVRDTQLNTTTRVSVDSDENQLWGDYGNLSDDGQYIVFRGPGALYIRDLVAGLTTAVSINSAGELGNANSIRPSLSANGGFVAYESDSTNLVLNDTNGVKDIFDHEVVNYIPPIIDTFLIAIVQPPPNNPPVVVADYYTPTEDIPLVVPGPGLLGNDFDPDGDTLTATVGTPPISGTLVIYPDGGFVYTPTIDFDGVITFTYQVWDGTITVTQMVTFTFIPVNDPPVVVGETYTPTEDVPLVVPGPGVLGNDYDVDGDTLTVTVGTPPISGTLVIYPDGGFVYTPTMDFDGVITFTYQVWDGTITVTQMVTLTFIPVNDAPIIGPDLYTATAGITLTVPGPGVLGNDYDVEGNPMSVLTYTMPITGVLVVNPDGGFEYYPPVTYSGTVTFTYTCDDGEGGTTIGIVTFTVSSCTVPTISVGPVTITHNVTQTDVILDWLGTGDANHYEIWYSTDTPDLDTNPYFTISGSCAAPGPGMFCDTSNTTDWAHVNGYGDPAINYFYKILGANSCGGGPWNPIEHKGEFDFTIVPAS